MEYLLCYLLVSVLICISGRFVKDAELKPVILSIAFYWPIILFVIVAALPIVLLCLMLATLIGI